MVSGAHRRGFGGDLTAASPATRSADFTGENLPQRHGALQGPLARCKTGTKDLAL